jgi:hypothetical protein
MEAICSSETSVETQRTARRYIPEDDTLQVLLCFESQSVLVCSPVDEGCALKESAEENI